MNTAVRTAIEARLALVNQHVEQSTQVLASYEHQLINLQTQLDAEAAQLTALEAERDELLAALPTEVEPAPEAEEQGE